MKRAEPFNATKIEWDWRRDWGRLRIGYMTRKAWWLYGCYKRSWFFVFRHYPIRDDEYSGMTVGGYWQPTILGLQVAYCYHPKFEPLPSVTDTSNSESVVQ